VSKKAAQRHQKAVAAKQRRDKRGKTASEKRQSKRLHDAGDAASKIQEVGRTAHAAASFGAMMLAVAKSSMRALQLISEDHKKTTGDKPQCVRCRRAYPCPTMRAVENAVQQVHIDLGTTLNDPDQGYEMTRRLLTGEEVEQPTMPDAASSNGNSHVMTLQGEGAVALKELADEAAAERTGPPPQEYTGQMNLYMNTDA
jgi:hypothetical protein